MGKGLKELWSLREPANVPTTPEASAFKQDFQTELKTVNLSLREAKVTADPAQRQALVTNRDKLFTAYHAVRQGLNGPGDGSTKTSARRVVEAARATAGSAKKLNNEAARGAKQWQTREPQLEQTATRIDELEQSGDERAPKLMAVLSQIQKLADGKHFKKAIAGLDQLANKLGIAAPAQAEEPSAENQPDLAPGAGNDELHDEKLQRGLHTLFLHRYNEESTENLAKLLAKYPGTVTLTIAPHFKAKEGGGDPYANVRTILDRLNAKQKKLRLTVYFGFHSESQDLESRTEELEKFLKDTMHPKKNFEGDALEFVSICPALEDYEDRNDTVAKGQRTTGFEQDVTKITKYFKARLFEELVTAGKLEFRRSPGGGVSADALKDDCVKVKTSGRNGKEIEVPVTHEYHHRPEDAAGYDTYAIDGPLVYDPLKESERAIEKLKGKKDSLTEPLNPKDQLTIDEFIEAAEDLEDVDGVREVMLWRPTYNLWSEKKENGKTVKFEKGNSIADRKDSLSDPAFDKHEMQLAKKFLYAGLDESELPKGKKPRKDSDKSSSHEGVHAK